MKRIKITKKQNQNRKAKRQALKSNGRCLCITRNAQGELRQCNNVKLENNNYCGLHARNLLKYSPRVARLEKITTPKQRKDYQAGMMTWVKSNPDKIYEGLYE